MLPFALALDLSSPKGSFCLFKSPLVAGIPQILVNQELPGTFTHSETLLTELARALSTHQLSWSQMEFMVVSSGPGSFTGLRIAFATVKAFSLTTGKPIIAVEGPEARARAFLSQKSLVGPRCLQVLTYLTADKVALSGFDLEEDGLQKKEDAVVQLNSLEVSPDSLVLIDERLEQSVFKKFPNKLAVFPLSAWHLSFCQQLKSSRVFKPHEISSLSPTYLGSNHFD